MLVFLVGGGGGGGPNGARVKGVDKKRPKQSKVRPFFSLYLLGETLNSSEKIFKIRICMALGGHYLGRGVILKVDIVRGDNCPGHFPFFSSSSQPTFSLFIFFCLTKIVFLLGTGYCWCDPIFFSQMQGNFGPTGTPLNTQGQMLNLPPPLPTPLPAPLPAPLPTPLPGGQVAFTGNQLTSLPPPLPTTQYIPQPLNLSSASPLLSMQSSLGLPQSSLGTSLAPGAQPLILQQPITNMLHSTGNTIPFPVSQIAAPYPISQQPSQLSAHALASLQLMLQQQQQQQRQQQQQMQQQQLQQLQQQQQQHQHQPQLQLQLLQLQQQHQQQQHQQQQQQQQQQQLKHQQQHQQQQQLFQLQQHQISATTSQVSPQPSANLLSLVSPLSQAVAPAASPREGSGVKTRSQSGARTSIRQAS